jgi:hypothetical protein
LPQSHSLAPLLFLFASNRYAEFTATCLALHASPGLDNLGLFHSGGEDMLLNDVRVLSREVWITYKIVCTCSKSQESRPREAFTTV